MAKASKRPTILITNDDGITAPGIRSLVEAVKGLGDITVVAPDRAQSGMGHAVDKILHRKPDICLSGINHGANHSINVIYSGTMSAAMEAAIESIPSIGFSLLDYRFEADFAASRHYIRKIVEKAMSYKKEKHFLLNVNIPAVPQKEIKGVKVCKQAYAKYEEDFDERVDPQGKKYYWLTGEFVNFDKGKDTDVWALQHNYISVVPIQFDLTNYSLKKELEKNWKIK